MKKKRANEILDAAACGSRNAALAALMVAGLLLAGCGQKGPLTLPSAARVEAKASPPTATPTPAADNGFPVRTDTAPR